MRPNEFTQIPIKKQPSEKYRRTEEADIEFLDYEEVNIQTRPKAARPTAARPQPKLQHPSGTAQRVARPLREQMGEPSRPVKERRPAQQPKRKEEGEPDIEFFDYKEKPEQPLREPVKRPAQQRPAQRPVKRGQQQKPPQRPKQPGQAQRPTQRAQQRPAEQRQQRPVQQRPIQQRPAQRPVQQEVRPARPVQQRKPQHSQTQSRPARVQQQKRPAVPTEKKQPKQKQKSPAAKSRFRKGLLIAWAAFAAVLAAALILLSVFLSNYEKSRPTDTIHRIVSAVEKGNLDDLHLRTEDGISLTDGQILAEPEEISSYILQKEEDGEEGKSGISFRVINGESDENKKVYLIKAGDQKILKIVIERSDKKYAFGFTGWQEKETILLSEAFPVSVLKAQIPQNDQLIINGKTIGRERITSEGDRIAVISRLIEDGYIGEQPTMDTYEIPGIYFRREVQASDPSGRTYDCILTADTYTGGFDAPQEFIDEQYGRVIDMFEPYALYFSGEQGRGALARIMLDNSPAYNSAISADVSWMQEHSDVEITDKTAENFKLYSDEVFSCDIGFLQTIYQGDEPVRTWDTNMTWIFVRDGDNYYIADFITKTADEG